jgi:hypothetical protein
VRVDICYSLLGVLFSKEDKYEVLVLIVAAPRFFDMICWQVNFYYRYLVSMFTIYCGNV